jgi:hypothetical protein
LEMNQDFINYCYELPTDVRELVQAHYRRFLDDPYYPGLHFKHLDGTDLYSIRIGSAYRALGIMIGEVIVWFWIGSHTRWIETPQYRGWI